VILNNRVIYKDNAVLTDLTRNLSDAQGSGKSFSLVAAEDAIYVGSDFPFNHRFFMVSAANTVDAVPAVKIWSGAAWEDAVDVLDFTGPAAKVFAQSGLIMFAPEKSKGWARAVSTEQVTDLTSLKIYNCFWAKLTFSGAAVFTLKYVGHKFSQDSDFGIYYADLNRSSVRDAFFGTSTPTFDAVHVAAAEEIIRDLRARQEIFSPNQILDPDQFRDAATHKAASIIYSSFGSGQEDRRDWAVKKYREAMNKLVFNVDKDGDGRLALEEKVGTSMAVRR